MCLRVLRNYDRWTFPDYIHSEKWRMQAKVDSCKTRIKKEGKKEYVFKAFKKLRRVNIPRLRSPVKNDVTYLPEKHWSPLQRAQAKDARHGLIANRKTNTDRHRETNSQGKRWKYWYKGNRHYVSFCTDHWLKSSGRETPKERRIMTNFFKLKSISLRSRINCCDMEH